MADDTTGVSEGRSIYDKSIAKKFPDWKQFWQQCQTAMLNLVGANAKTKDKVNAYFFA